MKRLKIILQYDAIFYLIFFLALIYSFISIKIPRTSKYDINDKNFLVTINDIFIDGNYLSLELIGKEKLQSSYYFDTIEEKEYFIENYKLGDVLKIEGELIKPSNNTIPNLFNYKSYLYYNNIFYTININSYIKITDNDNILCNIKNYLIKKINKIDKSSNYLHALILGDDRYIGDDINNIYQSIGISHLFAISGMHISILSGIILFILRRINMNKLFSYLITILFLIFYLFLTGCSPSILRATILFILLSINKLFKLNIKTFNVFLLTISIIIFIDPLIIFKVGFQFSTVISGGLILFSPIISKKNNYLSKLLMTSFVSFLLGIPICIYNFYQLNILSPIYNLFFVPFMSILIFPLTLLTIIFPILTNLLNITIKLLELFSNICYLIPSNLIFMRPSIYIIILYYVIIFFVLNYWKNNKRVLWIFIFLLMFHYNYNHLSKNEYIVFLDVGQGDSFLMYSKGESILIDTGGRIQYSMETWDKRKHASNISNSKIIPMLKSNGIKKINYMILTHGDYDHMGEAINLVENFKVEKVIFNCGEFNELELDLIKVLDKKKILYYSCIKELNIDDNKLYFLQTKEYDNENDNSNVIYTELNNYKFLFMGDAGVEVEDDLIGKYNLKDIDVLKVGHHGSKTSSGEKFINKINPKYGVISVGKNNRYGHPNKDVLDNLEDSKIYRTDQDGSIIFKIKNNKLQIETCVP